MAQNKSIYIGTAGWNYKDWYGIVYPEKPSRSFKELDYLAGFLDTVEINSTFYRPASPYISSAWIKKVAHNPRFLFTAKLWQRFTHERKPYTAEETDLVYGGMDPLAEAGKLGALLCQFPWSFKNDAMGKEWLELLIDSFKRYPLVMELRHANWDNEDVRDFLNRKEVGLATIDQPVIGNSISFKPVCTGGLGYVRMHGRNYRAWFPPKGEKETVTGSPSTRYDYLYSEKEITEIAGTVREVSGSASTTFVIQNNHPWGQAVANAIQLKSELEESDIKMPATLLKRFPFLGKKATPVSYTEIS